VGFLDEAKTFSLLSGKHDEIRAKLEPKDYKEFVAALRDPEISHVGIAKALKKRGIECAPNTVARIRERINKNVDE